jgi:hypothetical protein
MYGPQMYPKLIRYNTQQLKLSMVRSPTTPRPHWQGSIEARGAQVAFRGVAETTQSLTSPRNTDQPSVSYSIASGTARVHGVHCLTSCSYRSTYATNVVVHHGAAGWTCVSRGGPIRSSYHHALLSLERSGVDIAEIAARHWSERQQQTLNHRAGTAAAARVSCTCKVRVSQSGHG